MNKVRNKKLLNILEKVAITILILFILFFPIKHGTCEQLVGDGRWHNHTIKYKALTYTLEVEHGALGTRDYHFYIFPFNFIN